MNLGGQEIETEEHQVCKFFVQTEDGKGHCHISGQDAFKPDDAYKSSYCHHAYWKCARWKKAQPPQGGDAVRHLHDV